MAGRLATGLDHGLDLATLPDDPAGRLAALFGAIERFGSTAGRAVLVVDGCDLLLDVDGALDLTWLPGTVPSNVRVVLTTAGSDAVDEGLRRGWTVSVVPGLDEDERRAFIATFLGRWSKGLDREHVGRLTAAPQTASPLFLRTVRVRAHVPPTPAPEKALV